MLLRVKNLKKYFPIKRGLLQQTHSLVRAVDDVSLTVTRGQNLSIVGESGCGKTTLARLIMKIYEPDSGEIHFESKNITKANPRLLKTYRRDVQMVFQDPYGSLDPRYTIRQIIGEGLLEEALTAQDKELRIVRALSDVDLKNDILERYPHEFSGGERQRISIARALVRRPKLLILDEAVSSLDVLVQKQIIDLLIDLQKKHDLTYILISHNLRVVKRISHTIAVMLKGEVVEHGPAKRVFENPLHPYTQKLLLAALHYRTTDSKEVKERDPESRLTDHGDGHFVLG